MTDQTPEPLDLEKRLERIWARIGLTGQAQLMAAGDGLDDVLLALRELRQRRAAEWYDPAHDCADYPGEGGGCRMCITLEQRRAAQGEPKPDDWSYLSPAEARSADRRNAERAAHGQAARVREKLELVLNAFNDVLRPGRFSPAVDPVRWLEQVAVPLREAFAALPAQPAPQGAKTCATCRHLEMQADHGGGTCYASASVSPTKNCFVPQRFTTTWGCSAHEAKP